MIDLSPVLTLILTRIKRLFASIMSEIVLIMAMLCSGCLAGDMLQKLGGLEQFSQVGGDNGWELSYCRVG